VQSFSFENYFDLYENESVGEIHFDMNGGFFLRQKITHKWPVASQQEYLQREPLWVEVLVDKVNPMSHRHHQALHGTLVH